MIKTLTSLLLLLIFVSCGKQNSLWPTDTQATVMSEPATAEEFSYEFRGSKCSTNIQSFSTFEKACEGLKDDTLNNNCASNKREDLFINSKCSGNFS